MPRKGYKKPVPTQCATCGKTLPQVALRAMLRQLVDVQQKLGEQPREGASVDEQKRFARLTNLHARAALEMFLEDEPSFCFGHEKKAPGRKPAGDPSFPADPDVPRKRPGRKPKLQAVSNE